MIRLVIIIVKSTLYREAIYIHNCWIRSTEQLTVAGIALTLTLGLGLGLYLHMWNVFVRIMVRARVRFRVRVRVSGGTYLMGVQCDRPTD